MPSTAPSSASMSVISGVPANISGSAPVTSATARRLRSPTSWAGKRFSTTCVLPITPTTGLVIAGFTSRGGASASILEYRRFGLEAKNGSRAGGGEGLAGTNAVRQVFVIPRQPRACGERSADQPGESRQGEADFRNADDEQQPDEQRQHVGHIGAEVLPDAHIGKAQRHQEPDAH